MNTFQSRIHREWADVSGFVVSYMATAQMGFSFQHDADEDVKRTHVHTYFFQLQQESKSFSDQLTKKLGLKGNIDFSTINYCSKGATKRPIDISGAWCYGSKWGTIAPSFLGNISPDLVEQLQVYAKKMATVGNIAHNTHTTEIVVIKEIKVKTKPTQYEHANTCAARIMEKHPEVLHDVPEARESNLRNIFEMSYAYFRESKLYMGKYRQLDFTDMVMVILNAPDYKHQLFNLFVKRNSYQ